MPENTALWLNAKRAPFAVGPAPYTAPRADEIVVRVRAVAVNPFDRAIRTIGGIIGGGHRSGANPRGTRAPAPGRFRRQARGDAVSLVSAPRFRLRSRRFAPFFARHANRTVA